MTELRGDNPLAGMRVQFTEYDEEGGDSTDMVGTLVQILPSAQNKERTRAWAVIVVGRAMYCADLECVELLAFIGPIDPKGLADDTLDSEMQRNESQKPAITERQRLSQAEKIKGVVDLLEVAMLETEEGLPQEIKGTVGDAIDLLLSVNKFLETRS